MRKFVIDRTIWRCGKGSDPRYNRGEGLTRLLNKEGYMCCLGQICKQIGYDDEDIIDIGTPYPLRRINHGVLLDDNYFDSFSSFFALAIQINDDPYITNEERERQLIELGKKSDIEIEFIN